MPNTREWYQRVNAAWPLEIPTPTAEEAMKAARKLWRWGMGETWRGPIRATSGRNFTCIEHGEFRVNPDRPGLEGGGWRALVHDLSHLMWWRANGSVVRPHEKGHAKLELKMVKLVVARGWLRGVLRSPEKPPETPEQRRAAARQRRRESIERRIKQWESKQKRAANALRKLRRQQAAINRKEKA